MKTKSFWITILLVGFTNLSIFTQENISTKLFNDLRTRDEVSYLSFSKNMLDCIDLNLESDDDDSEHKVTGDLKEVKLAIYKPGENTKTSFRNLVLGYLKKGNYKQVEEDDNDDNTEVWVHCKGKKIYECHILFKGEKNGVLLSFFGDFKVEDVEKLKEKMNDYKQ